MSQAELLALVVATLDRCGIDHMVAGSYASSFHGEPRMTRDIDLVIDPDASSLEAFCGALDSERFHVAGADEALAHRDMFNVIDLTSGWKVDCIIKKTRPFSDSEFERRTEVEIAGVTVAVATAEDTILAKLEWSKQSASAVQRADVAALLASPALELDQAYLDRWADVLGVRRELDEARAGAG